MYPINGLLSAAAGNPPQSPGALLLPRSSLLGTRGAGATVPPRLEVRRS